MAVMDAAERQRFLETLRNDTSFREDVRRELLTAELLELPQTVATLTETVATLVGTVNVLVETVADQRRDFAALATDVRNYMERTLDVVSDLAIALRGEFGELRGELESQATSNRARFDQIDAAIAELKNAS